MNFLAHLFLADDTPESIIGNLMGDFVRGRVTSRFSAEMVVGIKLHRQIDSYTDRHPDVAASRRLLWAGRRHHAGIVVDIAYDHFLAVDWDTYAHESLDRFADRIYAVLQRHLEDMPPALRRVVPVMIADDWLRSYRQLTGVQKALDRVGPLVRGGVEAFADAVVDIEANYDALHTHFAAFFPDLIAFAADRPDAGEGAVRPFRRK